MCQPKKNDKMKYFLAKISKKFCGFKIKCYLCTRLREILLAKLLLCGNSSVGRARPCQGRGREFESRLPLLIFPKDLSELHCWRGGGIGRRATLRG